MQKKSLEFLASLDEILERRALDPEAEVQGQGFNVDAVRGEQLDVAVVKEGDAVQVDHAEVGRVCLDLGDVDHLVDVLFRLGRKLKGTWGNINQVGLNLLLVFQ